MKIWDYLNGKKTAIGATIDVVLLWISIQGWLDESTLTLLASLATIWTGVGISHKAVKHQQAKQETPRI